MYCKCLQFISQQAKVMCQTYDKEMMCLSCLSENVNKDYRILLNEYMGIYDCRECKKKKNGGFVK